MQYDFSVDFQLKVLSLLAQDSNFIGTYKSIIQPTFFTQSCYQELCEIIFSLIEKYNFPPSQFILTECIRNKKNCEELSNIVPLLYIETSYNEKKFIFDQITSFANFMSLKDAIIECQGHLMSNDYEQMLTTIKKALASCETGDLGKMLYKDAQDRVFNRREDLGEPIPVLIRKLDEKLCGGAYPKTLNLILAPTNLGKSAALCNIGAAAVVQGKKVIHFTCEMSEARTLDRYDARLTGFRLDHLYNDESDKCLVLSKLNTLQERFGGEVIVKEYPPNSASVETLNSFIEKVRITKNFVADLVIVDYGDLLKHKRFTEYRHQVGSTFTDLRGIGVSLNIPIWSATQTNRGGGKKDIVDIDDVSEDFEKIRVSDLVLTFSQTKEEAQQSILRVYGAKVRDGAKGWVITLRADFARMFLGAPLEFVIPRDNTILNP